MEREADKWQKCDEDVALNVPLIADHEGNQISGSYPNNNVTTTSFLKTCVNGLNALSGKVVLFYKNTNCFSIKSKLDFFVVVEIN
jgi:hypothetical protein